MNWARIGLALAMPLLLTSCLLTPGKFDAALNVNKGGGFTYRYNGEILLMTGQSLMSAAAARDEESFDPDDQICWDEEGVDAEPATHDCSAAELEAKRKEWEAGSAEREAKAKSEAAMMKAMLGGIDPADPKTMDEFARRLQGYEGWKRVTHKGNGVFDVQYEVTGRLDHDFVYPVFPGIDYVFPFVQVTRRTGGKIQIVAPALVESNEGAFSAAAMGNMVQGMSEATKPGSMKKPEGTFTLTTDAEILTNNTNDGPVSSGASKVLKWTVGPLDKKKPEALLQL